MGDTGSVVIHVLFCDQSDMTWAKKKVGRRRKGVFSSSKLIFILGDG